MDTLPMPLEELAATHGGLHEFRITSPVEVRRMLQSLCDGNVLLNFNAPDGSCVATRLWTVDAARSVLSFSAERDDPQLPTLLDSDEAVVVGYLDSVKLQFDVQNLMLVHNGRDSTLRCAFPREMWRFQRRNAFRVRPLVRNSPHALLRHPELPDMQLSLRVLDLSIGGCALFLPDDVPPVAPGVQLNGVQLELDDETTVVVCLRLHHVTGLNPDSRGVRLGCELVSVGTDTERILQRYIDQTQKKRRLMSLE